MAVLDSMEADMALIVEAGDPDDAIEGVLEPYVWERSIGAFADSGLL